MLVSRPTFDVDTLRPGDIIMAESAEWKPINGSLLRKIILIRVEPLKLHGVYYDPKGGFASNLSDIRISIKEVLSGEVNIYPVKIGNKVTI